MIRPKSLGQLYWQNGYLERTMPVDYEARPTTQRTRGDENKPHRDVERVVAYIKQRHLADAVSYLTTHTDQVVMWLMLPTTKTSKVHLAYHGAWSSFCGLDLSRRARMVNGGLHVCAKCQQRHERTL